MDTNQSNSGSSPAWFHQPWVPEILVCGITALAYLSTLAFGFVYDDVPQILQNPAIQSWHYLPRYFTSHVWAAIYPNSTGNYYRPIFLLWLRLNYVLFGARPAGWHATTIACHVLATYLVLRLTRQLTGERWIAFAAALLFGLHPAHIENVAWISGVTDPLMTCFALGSCSVFLGYVDRGKRLSLIVSLSLFSLALLAKETAIVVPALIFGLALIVLQNGAPAAVAPATTRAAAREVAPFALVTVAYIAVRFWALKGLAHPVIAVSWAEVLLTWPSVLWFYVRHLLFPLGLSEFYPLSYVHHPSLELFVLPLATLLAFGLVLYLWIRALPQRRVALFALGLMVLPLLPVLDLRALTPGDIGHDRYLYLPSVGFALLVAISVARLAERLPGRNKAFVPAALTAAVALFFAVLTVTQQMQWASDILLYTRGTETAPDNPSVRDDLGSVLLAANQPERALAVYHEVLRRNPKFWRTHYNLGYAFYKLGNDAAAEDYLQRAIQIDGSDPDQFIYLALVQLRLQKLPQAERSARNALARNPEGRGYHYVLAQVYEAMGDRAAAQMELKTEAAQHPDNAAAVAKPQELQKTSATPGP